MNLSVSAGTMKSRSSRLLSLFGLFTLLVGALGILSEESNARTPYLVLAAIGAGAIICSSLMRKDSIAAFAAAPAVTASGLLAGLWYGVRGWTGVGQGEAGVFLSAVLFSLVCAFSAVLTPTLLKTWKLQRRFYNLFETNKE